MTLVFVNRFFFPDHSATSQMLGDLAFRLAAEGHDVHVICSRQLYEDPTAHLASEQTVAGVHIHRAWSSSFGRSSLAGRACDYLSFYVGAALMMWRAVKPGAVLIAKTDPPLISIVAAIVAALKGVPLVNWLQDVFPEVAEQAGMRVAKGPAGRLLKIARDWSLRRAQANVAIGERMRELLMARGIDGRAITIIPNGADAGLIQPISPKDNPLIKEWDLDGKFVVMYSGNMGRAHEFGTILDAAEALQSNPKVAFLFVGGGARRQWLMEEVARRSLNNVRFQPYQPKERLAQSLSVGAVHLISLLPDQEGLIVPSKFYGVLGAGRATLFVGDPDGELARLIHQHDVGTAVEIGDSEGLAGAIERLAGDADLVAAMGGRARQALVDHYTPEQGATAWQTLLGALIREPVAASTRT